MRAFALSSSVCVKFASMRKVLTAAEMREVDRLTIQQTGISSAVLMETAANAVVREILRLFNQNISGKRFAILCGKGNNGGDGLAVARLLYLLGGQCRVFLLFPPDEFSPDARANYHILHNLTAEDSPFGGRIGIERLSVNNNPADIFESADCIIDAIFGTGLTKPISGFAASLSEREREIFKRNRRPAVLSIDVPSGLSAERTESADEAFIADLTVTFTSPKPENVIAPFYRNNGKLVIADIGSPNKLIEKQSSKVFLLEASDAVQWLKSSEYTYDSYKNRRGHLAIIAGSAEYSGAAVLAATAAMRSGVGLVTLFVPEGISGKVAPRLLPEIIIKTLPDNGSGGFASSAAELFLAESDKFEAVAVGCGLGLDSETKVFVKKLLSELKIPVIVDADALNAFAPLEDASVINAKTAVRILTPHEGEFRRLSGIEGHLRDRIAAVGDFAMRNSVILVLKGERVLIGTADGRIFVNPTGNSGLGKAGNGDTLTGLLGGFIAQAAALGLDPAETTAAAVYFAGTAGDIAQQKYGKRVMTASDVRDAFTDAFRKFSN